MIEVSGKATISVPPDVARFLVVIISEDKDAEVAGRENATRTTRVMNALLEAIGDTGSATTASFTVAPRHRWEDGKQILIGVQARYAIQVEANDLTRVGMLADVALAAGATAIEKVSFTVKDPTPLAAVTLALAAGRAKRKAEAMADAVELEVVRIVSIEERGGTPQPRMARQSFSLAESDATPFKPGTVEINAEVVMRVEVGPRKP